MDPAKDYEVAVKRRQALAADRHRPHYHFLPPDAWMNDPNGVIQWRGQYHLFYQHNPHAARWAAPHWGHAVSDDLVRWRDLPVALSPDAAPADSGGCYSGVAVDDGGAPVIIYTGVENGEQRTCLAFGDETLTTWRKFEGNPVARFPEGLEAGERFDNAFRDPFVWREAGVWYQLIGTSLFGRGQVLLYRSADLKVWEYLHPFVPQEVRDGIDDIGRVWECPSFFPAGDKHVLIVSLYTGKVPYAVAMTGTYCEHRFHPEQVRRLDWGLDCLYAPAAIRDAAGRRLVWGWLQEQRSPKEQLRAGWAGVMSLPRVLSIGEDGGLLTAFAPELETLREQELYKNDLELDGFMALPGVWGRQLELRLTLTRGRASRTGLSLRRSPGGEEETLVYIDWLESRLVVDKGRTSLSSSAFATVEMAELPVGDAVSLRLYLDVSVLEIIADDRVALTTRVYPTREDSTGLRFFSRGESGTCDVNVWRLGSIW